MALIPENQTLRCIWVLPWCHLFMLSLCFCKLIVALCYFEKNAQSRHNLSLHLTGFLPLHLIVRITTLWKCIEMRACMLLYLLCACDAIRTPLLSIICGVSVPHSARPQWGYFSQPSIQTWPITARLQKHFLCTQELTAVNGGYFQSLYCQSKCQVNTGQWKQL